MHGITGLRQLQQYMGIGVCGAWCMMPGLLRMHGAGRHPSSTIDGAQRQGAQLLIVGLLLQYMPAAAAACSAEVLLCHQDHAVQPCCAAGSCPSGGHQMQVDIVLAGMCTLCFDHASAAGYCGPGSGGWHHCITSTASQSSECLLPGSLWRQAGTLNLSACMAAATVGRIYLWHSTWMVF